MDPVTAHPRPTDVRPRWAITAIVVWVLLQIPRLIAIPLVGGVLNDRESDTWLYPAILDIVVAISAPLVAYAIWRKRGLGVWVTAIVFFVVSIVDHADAVTAGLTATTPRIFGGPADPSIGAAVVPIIQAVIDVVVLGMLTSKRLRAYYLGPIGSSQR